MSVKSQEYYRKEFSWMTPDQWECVEMLSDIYKGMQHVYGTIRPSGDSGITIITMNNNFATFDYNELTRAVLLAHDRCIRFSISPSGTKKLKLQFNKRPDREGEMSGRHPTIDVAIEKHREDYPTDKSDTH